MATMGIHQAHQQKQPLKLRQLRKILMAGTKGLQQAQVIMQAVVLLRQET